MYTFTFLTKCNVNYSTSLSCNTDLTCSSVDERIHRLRLEIDSTWDSEEELDLLSHFAVNYDHILHLRQAGYLAQSLHKRDDFSPFCWKSLWYVEGRIPLNTQV